MKLYTAAIRCGTCDKILGRVRDVPEENSARVDAMLSASKHAFCEGHTRNSNIEPGAWVEQAERLGPAPTAIAEEPKTAPKMTPDGIALEDLAAAALDEGMPPMPQVIGKDENGAPVPMTVIGKNPPRADQLG